MLNEEIINKIIQVAKDNELNIRYTGEGNYLLFDIDYKQPFKFAEICFSSIANREEFYINIPALNLYPHKDEYEEFFEDIEKAHQLINILNNYIDKLKEEM